jgi:hypothetical protein
MCRFMSWYLYCCVLSTLPCLRVEREVDETVMICCTSDLFGFFPSNRRIAKGAGRTERQAQELMADFQRMKVMMQNMAKMAMSKQGAPAPNASADPSAAFGNRSARRSGGKAGKKAMPKARGFGAK